MESFTDIDPLETLLINFEDLTDQIATRIVDYLIPNPILFRHYWIDTYMHMYRHFHTLKYKH
jgi:hypothetical protein